MTVTQTSLIAWRKTLKKLNNNQKKVLMCFSRYGAMTNAECAKLLGWSINRITPRVLELRRMKPPLLSHLRTRKCFATGSHASVWMANAELEPLFHPLISEKTSSAFHNQKTEV